MSKFVFETGATEKRVRIIAGTPTTEVVPVKYTLDIAGDLKDAKRFTGGALVYPQGEKSNGH